MKKILSALTTILSLLVANQSFATSSLDDKSSNQKPSKQAKNNDEIYGLFDTSIFSLSKKDENAFDAASSIYVLSSNDIRRSGATSIPEALRLVPGLQVARIDGNKWAISSRGFNAQFSNKLLVLVDGRAVYIPLFAGTFWDMQDYVLGDIEKIEVIRGSGGAVWGANAVNGVINIVTKNAVDTQGAYFAGIVGNQDRAIAEVRYGDKTKAGDHYRVYAKQSNRDEMDKLNSDQGNEDGYSQSQAGFRYDIRSIKDNVVAVSGEIKKGETDDYFNLQNLSTKPTDKGATGANLVASWNKTLSQKSNFILQSYLNYDAFDVGILKLSERTADVDFQYYYAPNRHHQISLGLGYRLIQDKIVETPLTNNVFPFHYEPNSRNDEIFSAFLQDKIGLIADRLYLTLGSKFEINDFTGFEVQPSAKLTLFPSRNQTAWASVSRAVRTPTRAEKSIQINSSGGTPLQKGDASYRAENVLAYELGYRIKPTRDSLIDAAIFYNDYDNLRDFQGDLPSTVTNSGKGQSFGAELTAKWRVMPNWQLEAGYDFLKIDLESKKPATESTNFPIGFAERQSPKNQFRFRSNYNITPKIEFDNIVYYVDSISDSRSVRDTGVKSYVRLDTRVGYLINSDLDVSVGVQNITDRRHQEFDEGLFGNETEVGRTIYFKTAVKF